MIEDKEEGKERGLDELNFVNTTLKSLPVDDSFNTKQRQTPNVCFSRVVPTKVNNPKMILHSQDALNLISLDPKEVERKDFAHYFTGNKYFAGAEYAAHCYCGHQFGYFSGQLGDGATMYIGEIVNNSGKKWEIQFKGAGKTPYSRTADGRKVLRSSLREFLCSEAMNALGVPTTRAGTCATSDSTVVRDIFYNGNQINERCTVITRIAQTFLRFGSFEIVREEDEHTGRAGPSAGNTELLTKLLEYVIQSYYPEIWKEKEGDKKGMYLSFYKEIVKRTAHLVALWQCVGFCHGVLNTDNMSIVGVTIDYGPFGFMEAYDPDMICNSSDDGGRYSYKKQPEICYWNCQKLADTLSPIMPMKEAQKVLDQTFWQEYNNTYYDKMSRKLGLLHKKLTKEDSKILDSLLETMYATGADWTNTFRALCSIPLPGDTKRAKEEERALRYIVKQCMSAEEVAGRDKPSMSYEQLTTLISIAQQDPRLLSMFGIRDPNVLIQQYEKYKKYKDTPVATPEQKEASDREKWAAWIDSYKQVLEQDIQQGLAASKTRDDIDVRRREEMIHSNPRFILRNYIAQRAITAAEKGIYSEAKKVFDVITDPYGINAAEQDNLSVGDEEEEKGKEVDEDAECKTVVRYDAKRPDGLNLRVT
eukprot:TRINITY_DN1774_c0_g1_i1.p1 TRINITY_DN1774_c0_g1~~TRINITY_DN1774_c0_g1_i1.p1  ORF type:complete len:734 (-),score=182.06 TRINITY_DN1774_c0_g1_i1:145-2082(-)